jgi:hypothetical protein
VGVPVAVTGGTVTLNANGTLTFAPALNYNGSPSFSYTISDGTTTATATVNGTVTPVSDAPIAAGDSVTIVEDTPFTFDPRGNDSDIDGDPLNITQINGVNIASGGSVVIEGGTVTLNANGTLTVSPAANYNGPISFTYTISDGAGGSASATVSGTVTPVNDAPVAIADVVELTEDGSATFDPRANDTDTEGNPLSITQINGSPITVGVPISVLERQRHAECERHADLRSQCQFQRRDQLHLHRLRRPGRSCDGHGGRDGSSSSSSADWRCCASRPTPISTASKPSATRSTTAIPVSTPRP